MDQISNFKVEHIDNKFSPVDFGRTISTTITRSGDLASRYYYTSYNPNFAFSEWEPKNISIEETNNETNECIVCWESLKENVLVCSTCKYAYHKSCYSSQIVHSCPNCRQYVNIYEYVNIV